MNILVRRFSSGKESTIGCLYIDGKPECFTLEDEYRAVKVAGETRVPAGKYEIKYREALTPMTEKYRKQFPEWFTYHLEMQDVPNFKYCYIHKGNIDDHTEGCLLVADSATLNAHRDGYIGSSTTAFTRFYPKIQKALESGEKVWIEFEDTDGSRPVDSK
jgi:hypothetical protein